MKIPCSNCNQRLEIPEELAGQTIECPACNASLAVPAMAAPPPTPAQVQESAPQADSSKKSKSLVAKWGIAAVFGVALVILAMVFSGGSNDVSTLEPTTAKAERKQQQPSLSAQTLQPQPPDKPFYDRAMMGDIEGVKQHLAAGTDVNTQNKNGRTALHWATVNVHKDIVELLINEGADVNLKDLAGETPLDWIGASSFLSEEAYLPHLPEARGKKIKSEKDEIAYLLRKHGAKTSEELKGAVEPTIPSRGSSPTLAHFALISAARTGNIAAIKQHLTAGVNVNVSNNNGQTPLHFAAKFGLGRKATAELLITKGAEVNAKSIHGKTPLDWAKQSIYPATKPKIITLLRKHGAKTGEELRTNVRFQPAASATYPPITKQPVISFHDAAKRGNIDAVKKHLAAGTDVNIKAGTFTPLHNAAAEGHEEIVKLLIVKGANINAKNGYGHTPLNTAAIIGRKKIVDLLRKHGGKTGEELKAEGKW